MESMVEPKSIAPEHEKNLLCLKDIERIGQAAVQIGIHNFKITGGEPLLRPDVPEMIQRLKKMKEIKQVTLTTNGVLLKKYLPALKTAGVDSINVSLDTLNSLHFQQITGHPVYESVAEAIKESCDMGIQTKINCLPMKKLNEQDFLEVATLAKHLPIDVRFIELMPIGLGAKFHGISNEEVFEQLKNRFGTFQKINRPYGNGPARYYKNQEFSGNIGFISAVTHEFCSECNRVRITSNGFLKLCLQYQVGVDLKGSLDQGVSTKELAEIMRTAILHKPEKHQFQSLKTAENKEDKTMEEIGG